MSPRRIRPAASGSALVAWGWFAVTMAASADVGGDKPGLLPHAGLKRAFWAAWWTGDPRREPDRAPDDYGFVDGHDFVAGEAITLADRRIREAMGRQVYAISVGEPFARAAFREGAPTRRTETTDFEAVALAWLAERGLLPTATVTEIKAAWKAFLLGAHPDQNPNAPELNLEKERERYAAARTRAERAAAEVRTAEVAAGKLPLDKRLVKKAKRIARDMRARLELVAQHLKAKPDMGGLCHFAAGGLVEALRAEGLHAVAASSGGHSFAHVLLDGHEPLLVDITATQFGLKPMYVRLPGQRRDYVHTARTKGHVAKEGAAKLAAADVENAPERWWALDGTALTAALRRAGTRFSASGQRLQVDAATSVQLCEPMRKKPRAAGRAAPPPPSRGA